MTLAVPTSKPAPLLELIDLSKSFTLHEQGRVLPSCHGVSLSLSAGELCALQGPTGAGKSTVLKCVYRTYLATAGEIWWHGAEKPLDLARCSEAEILALRRRDMAFVTQFLHCLPRQSALAVVAQPLLALGIEAAQAQAQAAEALERLQVPAHLWGVPPATFSGGEKQRVNLARAVVLRPRLLLLDEPTASLDPHTTDIVVDLLQSLKAQGVAMLAIFHQPDLIHRLAERVCKLSASESAQATHPDTPTMQAPVTA